MTLIDHLEELRQRILVSLLGIVIVTAVALFFSDKILAILLIPAGGMQLNSFRLMDGVMIKFHISLYVGIAAAFPIWAFQLYRFFSPAMLENERRAVLPALVFSTLLFALGAAFGYYFLQEIIKVFRELYPAQVNYIPEAQDYIEVVLFFLLTCGLAFQLPVLLTIMIQLRILSVDLLQKQRRIAYFVLFVIAEVVTPVTDPFLAPMIVMIPLVVLYEISILAGRRIESQRRKSERREAANKPMPEMEPAQEQLPTPTETIRPENFERHCTQCGTAPKTLDARYCDHCGNLLGEAGALA
jgi:sec-independent protein translocase protein TatC